MRCYIQVICTPAADTPGTLFVIHFDDKRYLFGQLAEGSQRAYLQLGLPQRKISDIFLTGQTEWKNTGGLLGFILNIADIKSDMRETANENLRATMQKRAQISHPNQQHLPSDAKNVALVEKNHRMNIYGGPNLNHTVAASRRFIFRTGLPINITEFSGPEEETNPNGEDLKPTWTDENLKVWAMAVLPQDPRPAKTSRKRSFDESNGTNENEDSARIRKDIVGQMFNSDWRMDRLIAKPLSEVRLPATIFVRDPETKQLHRYRGPLPGANEPVPDLDVLVREPWPGALTESLPPSKPSPESISYILKNHPQRGKFMPEKAKELCIPKGELWSKLAHGEIVQNQKGEDIRPDQVLQPGKPGGGCAILDLPSADYIEPLLKRGELQSKEIMEGVEAIIWVLGQGLGNHPLVTQFQDDHADLKHIVSYRDESPSDLVLESAAKMALRNNAIDQDIFPIPRESERSGSKNANQGSVSQSHVLSAQKGLVITLEPKVSIEEDKIVPPLETQIIQSKISNEVARFDKQGMRYTTDRDTMEEENWRREIPGSEAEVIVLGTGSSHPSKQRNVSGTLIRVPGCGSYLFDCGEGTLGTMRRLFSESELTEVLRDLRMIWISHLHADHHLGTTSVVKAWHEATRTTEKSNEASSAESPHSNGSNESNRLAIVSSSAMHQWLGEYGTAEDIGLSRLLLLVPVPVQHAASRGDTGITSELYLAPAKSEKDKGMDYLNSLRLQALSTVYVNHCRGAQAISVTFSNGLKVSYSGDCRPSRNFATIGRNSHILIHEATFEDDKRSEALAKKHSTTGEALVVASEMKAKACILTHFSQRYPSMPPFGAIIKGRQNGQRVEDLTDILEVSDDEENINALNATNGDPIDGPGSSTWTETNPASKGVEGLNGDKGRLIDEGDVQRLIASTGIKVIFAWDYMRLKLASIPRLVRKQPLLRDMYENDVGNVESFSLDQALEDEDGIGAKARSQEKQKQKQANKQKKAEGHALDNERKQANQRKWAEIGEYVTKKNREYGLMEPEA